MSRSWSIAVVLTLAVAPAVVLTAQQTTPPLDVRLFSSSQAVVLLFDLSVLQGENLQHAVETAKGSVDSMWARSNVGLDVEHLYAVKTLGTALETIQDYTSNPDLIHSALVKVAARQQPVTVAEPDGRIQALSTMCGELSRAQRGVVIYYDVSVGRGLEPVDAVRSLARACGRPNVLFAISYFSTSTTFTARPSGPPPVGLSVRIVPHQSGSPVSIVESMSPLDDGYASVVLRDDADKAIRSVTLGALVRPADPAMTTPQVFIRRGPTVVLLPRATTAIAVQLIDQSTLDAFARKGADVEIGVVGVEFADGSTWTYDLAAKGRFER
ncbi:MAG TPA: hypothetical protein VJN96_00420 [Vicinamibacterales bacterium]|nr:hypothetical protein [Vicinamibacterales bacterium]